MRWPSRILVFVLVGAAACSGRADVASPHTVRLELPVAPDVPDLPRLIVPDGLKARGYAIEVSTYTENAFALQAVLSGNLDFARIPMPQILGAIQQGAAITMVVGGGDQTRILASLPDIKTCADLHHRQVAIPNLISVQTLLLKRYVATSCPGTEVELMVIPGVENRLAALLARRTSAALLESANMFELEKVHGSQFRVLSDLALAFPGLNGAAFVTSHRLAENYPAIVRDFVRETVLATRRINDPAELADAVETYLRLPPDRAAQSAQLYLERRAWDVNGGLTDDVLEKNIQFYVEAGVLKAGLTPSQVADRSHLTAVLDEIGHK